MGKVILRSEEHNMWGKHNLKRGENGTIQLPQGVKIQSKAQVQKRIKYLNEARLPTTPIFESLTSKNEVPCLSQD